MCLYYDAEVQVWTVEDLEEMCRGCCGDDSDGDDESITLDIRMNQDYVNRNGENRQVEDRPERENNLVEFTYDEAEHSRD